MRYRNRTVAAGTRVKPQPIKKRSISEGAPRTYEFTTPLHVGEGTSSAFRRGASRRSTVPARSPDKPCSIPDASMYSPTMLLPEIATAAVPLPPE